MVLDNAQIYFEGIGNGHDYKEKIQQIINAVKVLYPSSQVNMRLIKNERSYEALLWGNAKGIPIGLYNRGQTLRHVLETLYRKVRKETLMIWTFENGKSNSKGKTNFHDQSQLSLAS